MSGYSQRIEGAVTVVWQTHEITGNSGTDNGTKKPTGRLFGGDYQQVRNMASVECGARNVPATKVWEGRKQPQKALENQSLIKRASRVLLTPVVPGMATIVPVCHRSRVSNLGP